MKLATYLDGERQTYGVVTGTGIVEAVKVWPDAPTSVLGLLEAGDEAVAHLASLAAGAEATVTLDEATLLAPIPQPPKAIGLAVNYVAHHNELQRPADMPEAPRQTTTPRPFIMPPTAVTGPGAEIPWPACSEQVDYELELAVVIGRTAKCVSAADAMDYVAGYTIANDVSARSVTHANARAARPKDAFFDWLHGKWSDGFLPTGPYLVTADEIPDPGDLDLELTVNGETRQRANSSLMIFTVGEIVAFTSQIMTLTPGDIIATGTPSGVGAAEGRFLDEGDVITCRIRGLGELTNTLGPRPEAFYTPCQP